jgi:hypothetical protein
MAKRLRRVKRKLGADIPHEEYEPDIKGTFSEGTRHLRKSLLKGDDVRSRRKKNVRLGVILCLLLVVFWFLFLV